jgi:raffinose/stachyose/melibiose transport system permease protein
MSSRANGVSRPPGWPRIARRAAGLLPQYLVAVVVSVIVVVPILIAVVGGFKTTGELMSQPFRLPAEWLTENYMAVLRLPTFWQQLGNSLFVALGTVALTMGASSLAAFVFARMEFKRRDLVYNFFTIGLMFPLVVAILPLYLIMREIGLNNSLLGVIIVQAAYAVPQSIVILRSFFRALPGDLEDAAKIDGCSEFGFFWRVLIPLSAPAIAANSALGLVVSWNALFLPLVVLDDQSLWTLPLGTMQFQGEHFVEWARTMSFIVIALIPAMLFYFLAGRYIVSGLTRGAVKG